MVYLLGNKWEATITILPILAVLGLIKSITASANSAFLSVKKQKYITFGTLVNILILGVTIVPFVTKHGLLGAGLAGALSAALSLPVIMILVVRVLRGARDNS